MSVPEPDPTSSIPGMLAAFEENFTRGGEDDCWIWEGSHGARGYGLFCFKGQRFRAHRAGWLLYRGPIPDGLVVDHVAERGCTNIDCVNPAHLEPVTQRENVLRGRSVAATRARQTHCSEGHEFDNRNTGRHHGNRRCLRCHRDKERARYARKREVVHGTRA